MTKSLLNELFRYAFSLTKNEEKAYDLVSYAVEKLMEKTLVLNKKAYLKTSIRNRFFDTLKKKTEELVDVDISYSYQDLEKEVIDKNLLEVLLNALSPEERELLFLWSVEGYSISQISKLQKAPRGTLTSRLSRIKAKLEKVKGVMDCE